jgi:hypothetical protein
MAEAFYDSLDPPHRNIDTPVVSANSSFVDEGEEGGDFFTTVTRRLSFLFFDQAKELCDKEEKASSPDSVWHMFASILSHLVQAEKSYYSLVFLEKSWIFMSVKKEPQKASAHYDSAVQQLTPLRKLVDSDRDDLDPGVVEDMMSVIHTLPHYVHMRSQMMDLYTALSSKGRPYIDSEQANKDLFAVSEGIKDKLQCEYMKHLKSLIQKEVNLLLELLKTQFFISQWEYLPSLLQLESIQNRLHKWRGVNTMHTMSDRKPGILHKATQQLHIPLYQWICKLYTTLLAKFSLYFYCILAENATTCDLQNLSEKLEPDFVARLRTALLQTSLKCVCVVFDSNGLTKFKGPGYHLPNTPTLELKGISSFPIVIKFPQMFDITHHMPNLVSLLFQVNSKPGNSSLFDADEKMSCAYHILKVDMRMYLVGICSSPKTGRNTKAQNTLNEIGSLLRLSQVIGLLKNM